MSLIFSIAFLYIVYYIVKLSLVAGSFEEDTTLPKGLENWNREKEQESEEKKEASAKS